MTELKKIRKYLQQRSQKTWFEIRLMNTFDIFLKQALTVAEEWSSYQESGAYRPRNTYCHGDYQYHNILRKGEDWFLINFDGNTGYNDGFYYEGWEGHYELVKLNLRNPAVVDYLLECVKFWVDAFDIDGLRLDVAYSLDHDFMRRLRAFCESIKPGFALIGEVLFGDYNIIVNDQMLHSCTNYECYKGIFSSLNDMNFFEMAISRALSDNPSEKKENIQVIYVPKNEEIKKEKPKRKKEDARS